MSVVKIAVLVIVVGFLALDAVLCIACSKLERERERNQQLQQNMIELCCSGCPDGDDCTVSVYRCRRAAEMLSREETIQNE